MSTTGQKEVDPATVEIIRNNFVSAAEEMADTLDRTAYNPVIYEIRDYGITLYDGEIRSIGDSPGSPLFLGSNDFACRATVEYLGKENFNQGDVVMVNYPYRSAGHTFDIILISPIYYDEEIVGFASSRAHTVDVGSMNPGYAINTTSLHQEGISFPGTKIHKKGEPDKEIIEIFRHNSRMPDKAMGDINAQIAAIRAGRERVHQLYEKYGKEVVEGGIDRFIDHGARVAREAVEELPDGTWRATDHVDGTKTTDELVRIEVEVTIDGGDFTVDFSGSSDEVNGPLNIPFGFTQSISRLPFKMVTTPKRESNEGHFEPLKVKAPEGNLFHATYPSATGTLWPAIIAVPLIIKALGKGMPERVAAQSGGDHPLATAVGVDPDTGIQFTELPTDVLGWGATAEHDGASGLSHTSLTNTRNVPIEVQENRMPLEIGRYELRQDSGGPGKQRGGLGIRRDFNFNAPMAFLSTFQKTKTENTGLLGGKPGAKNAVALVLDPDDEKWEDRIDLLVDNNDLYPESNKIWTGLSRGQYKSGESVEFYTAGGAGYDDPLERDPKKVRDDVIDDYVSRGVAREEYGVVITPEDEIDWDKTRSLRDTESE